MKTSSRPEPPPPDEKRLNSLAGRKILMVDDDRLNLRILSGILRGEGYVLAEADSGEKALELYATFQPDLVLLDVVMSGINGFDTCRRLRERYGAGAAPVIFITAKTQSDDVVEGFLAGGVDYLPKPFRPNEAVARIRTHLNNRVLSEQQKSLVDQLSKANQSKNRFLGMAAHDLRNPLASIRGLSEFLQDDSLGTLNAEQLDLVKMIHMTSHQMLDLVNELLDVATIESGELKIRVEPTSIVELVERAVHLMNMESIKKHTKLILLPHGKIPTLALDPAKMRQVLENLLSNGIKYSPPGSTITVDVQAGETHVSVAVRDQGPGIPENERDKLFKDFGRLSVKPTGGEKSTGLGLAICRNIVEAHQGTITAENLPERGCEFRVKLPILNEV
ncbi:MAG: hybrid sensor histidine kinase/response regulator [Opitutaceae bacterium]|nr:hybrid sensor histidine kinase/response regulator [Opitutaceae bacterium]